MARERWPFRPVLALRPTLGGRTVASLPLEVPVGAHLRTAVGTHAGSWQAFPPVSADFTLDVVTGGVRERLFERTLDPQRNIADRGWFDVDVPLDRYAGQRVELEFGASTSDAVGENLKMAGFAEPRLVVPSRAVGP